MQRPKVCSSSYPDQLNNIFYSSFRFIYGLFFFFLIDMLLGIFLFELVIFF